jgi:hypothetical protein
MFSNLMQEILKNRQWESEKQKGENHSVRPLLAD